MNTLFVLILILIAFIARLLAGDKKLMSNYLNLGYIVSLMLIWNVTMSSYYYVYITLIITFFYIFELYFSTTYKKSVNYNFESKLFIPLLLLNIMSFSIMFINFINRYGFLNPLEYGHTYENNLYLPGLTLVYRSIIPLYTYSVYKIFYGESSRKLHYFTIVYSFTTLFIKFNKTDIAILLLIMCVFVYDKYLTKTTTFKHKAKALIIIGLIFTIFFSYFSIFYTKIFRDDIMISNQIVLYASGGQLFLDYNLQNNIWARFEYFNFLNIFSGYIKPDRIVIDTFSTNVYGLLGDIFNDFNYFGIVLGPAILNLFFIAFKRLTKDNIIGYVFLAAYFTLAFFNPYVLLVEFWVQVFYIIILSRSAKYYV